jgi:hypothetical protein
MIKPAILRGAKEIAEYMGISRSTLFRYKHLGLPVTLLPGGGMVTTTSLLSAWYAAMREADRQL